MQVPYVLIADGEQARKHKIANQKLTIGRHPDNHVAVQDHLASRFHAEIRQGAAGWVICDLKSANGTRLNGRPIQEAPLKSSDVIEIGSTRIRFMNPDADLPPPPPATPDISMLEQPQGVDPDLPPIDLPAVAPPPAARAEAFNAADNLSPEDRLVHMAAGVSPGFFAFDIVILNARGQIALPPPKPVAGRRAVVQDAGEPQLLLRLMLLVCAGSGASDIHIEPREKDALVRIRVDGNMVDACVLDQSLALRLLSMIKVLCDIDISHKMDVQEGHFSARLPRPGAAAQPAAGASSELRRVDYRVSFAPGVFGQKLVIRVQDNIHAPALIHDLLLPDWMLEELRFVITQDSGMVLVSGPTGSGKTTTLYALLRSIDASQRNVVTIENPVEIQIPGITQLPVDDAQGKTFSALLRSVLRQDPDILLVGEIRDEETARTAMQAAITGHLVFSTLHTKDTFGTIYRLLDLGVEPFLLSQALATVVAQRLVRRLCNHCKQAVKPTPDQVRKLSILGTEVGVLYEPVGCDRCFKTGFSGRRAIFELLSVNESMRDAISRNKSLGEIADATGKFVKLLHTGYQLAADGISTFDDVERIVGR